MQVGRNKEVKSRLTAERDDEPSNSGCDTRDTNHEHADQKEKPQKRPQPGQTLKNRSSEFDLLEVIAARAKDNLKNPDEAVAKLEPFYPGQTGTNRPQKSAPKAVESSQEQGKQSTLMQSSDSVASEFNLMDAKKMRANEQGQEDPIDNITLRALGDSELGQAQPRSLTQAHTLLPQKQKAPAHLSFWGQQELQKDKSNSISADANVTTARAQAARPATSRRPVPAAQPGAYTATPGTSVRRIEELRFSLVGNTGLTGVSNQCSEKTLASDLQLDHPATTARTSRDVGLAVADMISESSQRIMGEAEAVDDTVANERRHQRNSMFTKLLVVGGFCSIFATAIAVLLVLLLPRGGDVDATATPASSSQTGPPSPGPTLSTEDYLLSLFPKDAGTLRAIEKPNSPQAKAFDWLLNDTEINTLSDDRIIQRFALVVFFFAAGGPNWFKKDNWLNHSAHECQWYSNGSFDDYADEITYVEVKHNSSCEQDPDEFQGVSEEGTIQHIWLASNRIQGELSPEFFWLTNLRSINFDACSLEGTFPRQFAELTSLEALSLMANRFRGSIPSSLFMPTLTSFMIANNWLTGTIPTEIGIASGLKHIILDSNRNINGTIPTQIGLLKSMERLHLDTMQLRGKIPKEAGLMTRTTEFLVYETLITGTIPTQLGQLVHAVQLELDVNSLTGKIPTELGNLSDLEVLTLFENLLSGEIPSEFGQLDGLAVLQLQFNDLTGSVPLELAGLANLEFLLLHENDLTGKMPEELCYLNETEFNCTEVMCGCDCPCNDSENSLNATNPNWTAFVYLNNTEDTKYSEPDEN